MIKKEYLQPEVEIVHVAVEESMMTGSPKGTGANVTWAGSEQSIDDFFN